MAVAICSDVALVDKSLAELTDEELKLFRKANRGVFGAMRYDLDYYHRWDPKRARAVALYTDEGQLAAWALLFPPHDGRFVHFFTRPAFRRRGYGTQLARYLRGRYRKIEVCPWDKRSSAFFRTLPYVEPAQDYDFRD